MMSHEPYVPPLTWLDYLNDFTDFLALFAGWGVVAVFFVTMMVLILRPLILRIKPTRIQRVTAELFIAINMLIARSILLNVLHRRDLPQPYRVVFWVVVLTLGWKFFYFALWRPWLRPATILTWNILVAPRLARIRRRL